MYKDSEPKVIMIYKIHRLIAWAIWVHSGDLAESRLLYLPRWKRKGSVPDGQEGLSGTLAKYAKGRLWANYLYHRQLLVQALGWG